MTIQEALDVSHRSVSFRDAEVLLAHILKKDRAFLHAHPEYILSASETETYLIYLRERESNKPVAHIIGFKEFFGRPFLADARALIPRPETELLVERAIATISDIFHTHLNETGFPCPIWVLELGTGGGCISITLALELAARAIPTTLIASEISEPALNQARENWKALSQNQALGNITVTFLQADLFAHPKINQHPFDLLIANLPYVEDTWRHDPAAQADVVFFEPEVALFGGSDGLDIYRRFFQEAPGHLTTNGSILVEYGETQTPLLLSLVKKYFPNKNLSVQRDYAGLDRVLEIK